MKKAKIDAEVGGQDAGKGAADAALAAVGDASKPPPPAPVDAPV